MIRSIRLFYVHASIRVMPGYFIFTFLLRLAKPSAHQYSNNIVYHLYKILCY